MTLPAPDLTQRPPRSPRTRLGGYVLLPRLIDKARATLADRAGAYRYNSFIDSYFFEFTGVSADALFAHISTGAGDWEILEWVRAHRTRPATPSEIENWSSWAEHQGPSDREDHESFARYLEKRAPGRDDLSTRFALLELDDHLTFGGPA